MIGWKDKNESSVRTVWFDSPTPAVTFPGFFQPIQRILIRDPLNSISLSDEPLKTELRIKDNIQ